METAPYAVETRALVKEFSGFRAVDSVDLRLDAGRVHALVGPNGAGKTSLFNLLTGFLRPTSGRILLFGQDATGLSPEKIARRGVARSFQITSLFANVPEASGVATGAIFVVIVLAFRRGLWPTLADLISLVRSRSLGS